MSTKPTPTHLTLLLKSHRTTLLLHSAKDLPLSTLKTHLLSALQSRGPALHGTPLPASADDISLALPADPADLAQGWRAIDDEDGRKTSPASLGLREGSVLAFKFGDAEGWEVEVPVLEEEEELEEGGMEAEDGEGV